MSDGVKDALEALRKNAEALSGALQKDVKEVGEGVAHPKEIVSGLVETVNLLTRSLDRLLEGLPPHVEVAKEEEDLF